MNVEREIAGFSLPFVIGVIITVFAGASFCAGGSSVHAVALTVCLISVSLLMLRSTLKYGDAVTWALITAAACGCGALSGASSLSLVPGLPESGIRTAAEAFGVRMQEAIDRIPFRSAETGALIKALLTGERSDIPREITEAFRDSGASHILALSGLHLGILYGILSKVLSFLGNGTAARHIRAAAVIVLCGFYTLATGAGPSIVRAFIFIFLGETARLTGRFHSLKQILMASMTVQLLLDPLSVRSAGFQLSYAAIAGIAFIYPHMKGFWPQTEDDRKEGGNGRQAGIGRGISGAMRRIWDSAALSISCQIATGPLAYMYFGTFPRHFLLTNLLALPLTGVMIPCALLTLALSVLGCCPSFMISVTELLVRTLTWSLEVIASM